MIANSVAHLQITLDDVKPVVRRRIEVPLALRLDRLHLVFQAAMGWTNSHLYEIRAGATDRSTPARLAWPMFSRMAAMQMAEKKVWAHRS